MNEFFPLMAGMAIGLGAATFRSQQLRFILVALLSVVVGFIASFIGGELAVSWGFVLFDIGQVLLIAILSMTLAAWWQRRRQIR